MSERAGKKGKKKAGGKTAKSPSVVPIINGKDEAEEISLTPPHSAPSAPVEEGPTQVPVETPPDTDGSVGEVVPGQEDAEPTVNAHDQDVAPESGAAGPDSNTQFAAPGEAVETLEAVEASPTTAAAESIDKAASAAAESIVKPSDDAAALFDASPACGEDPFTVVEATGAAPTDDASALFGAPASGEDPFTVVEATGAAPNDDTSALFGAAPASGEDPFTVVEAPDTAPTDDASALFGAPASGEDPVTVVEATGAASTNDASVLFGAAPTSGDDPFTFVEAPGAAHSDDSSALFGAPASGEDPFADIGNAADQVAQQMIAPQEQTAQQEQQDAAPELATEPAQSEGAPLGDAAPGQGDMAGFGGGALGCEVEGAAYVPLGVDVHAANDFAGTGKVVELGSPMKDPSSLFGDSAPGSNDFFSSLAPPADDPFAQVQQLQPATDPFAQVQGGFALHDYQQPANAPQATPAHGMAAQHGAYYQETPNTVAAQDLFGASAEHPHYEAQASMQTPSRAPGDASVLFGATPAGVHGAVPDASVLFGSTPAPANDAFAQVAAAQQGATAFDPFHSSQQHEDTSGLPFGTDANDTGSIFGAPPPSHTAADGGDVSNLFGPPAAMPDIFGAPAGDDPFGSIVGNHEASFFDSLAASAPAPAAQQTDYSQQHHAQHHHPYEQPSHGYGAHAGGYMGAQGADYAAPNAVEYAATPQPVPHVQDYSQAPAPEYPYHAAQTYNQAPADPNTQAGPWDDQAASEDDPFAQIAQQHQYQYDAGAHPWVPQPDVGSSQAYYEQAHSFQQYGSAGGPDAQPHPYDEQAVAAHDYGASSSEPHAQQYSEHTAQQYADYLAQGGAQQDPFVKHSEAQQPSNEHAEMLQQGVAAAFAQGAFQQQDDEGDTFSASQPAASEVSNFDELPFPWQAHVDPGSGCIYYFNTQTGVSSWEPPAREDQGSELAPPEWLNDARSQEQEQTSYGSEQVHAQQDQQFYGHPDAVAQQQEQQQQQQPQYYSQADAGAYNYGQAPGTSYEQQPAAAHNYGQAQATTYEQQPAAFHTYGHGATDGSAHQQAQPSAYGQQYNAYADAMQQPVQQQQQPMVSGARGGYTGNIMMPSVAAQDYRQGPATSYAAQPGAHDYAQTPAQNYSMQQPHAMHGGIAQVDSAPRRAPHAVMCFGMGGQLVVAMPGVRRAVGVFTGNAEELDVNRPMCPPPVSIYKMQDLPSQTPLFRQLEDFPGPLANTAATKKAVKAFIAEQVQNPSSSDEELSINPGTMRLLWELLGIMVDCNGDLSAVGETSKVVGNDRIAELLKDPNFAGDQFLNSGGGAGGFNMGGIGGGMGAMGAMGMAGGVMDPANRLMPVAPVDDVQVQQALHDMQELLLQGRRDEACQKALENELWAPALLLSSYMNIEMYQRVMAEFAKRSFKVGTPLRTLYMLFAGQGQQLFDPDTLEPLLDSWQANLSMLLNNRTPGDTDVLVNIGEGLWKLRKDVEAAHVCMMLAGEEVQCAESPQCRMALVGSDHRANPSSFATASAIQRTEIWEYAVKLKSPKKEFSVVMAYKLQYAMILAESGSKEKALAYVESLSAAMHNSLPSRLRAEVEMFEHRLRMHMGGKAAAGSSAFKGSFFGGLKKVLDTAVSSAIYGSAPGGVPGGIAVSAAAMVPAPPSQAPSDKIKAIQAAAAEKERQAKLKAQQQLEMKREAEEKKRAEKEAKEAAKKKSKKDKEGEGKGEEEEKKGLLSKLWGAVAGEKQADLGEENTMYYNEQLGRWVEKGKEHEVEAEAVSAPPPTMAAFAQPAQPAGAAGAMPGGGMTMGMPMGTPNGAAPMMGTPAAGGMGTPGGGNMFARQSRTGARSRYVDTLNPNAGDSTPVGGGAMGGMGGGGGMGGMGGMGGGAGAAKPKPQYKIFVPQAQTSGDTGAQQ